MKPCKLTIIGERINSTRKSIARAIEARDAPFIQNEARLQHEAGADFIDVNAGVFLEKEVEYLPWLVRTVQEAVDSPLSLDTPNPEALQAALKEHRGIPLINSITHEKRRLEGMTPLAREYGAKVIALCVDDVGMPGDREQKREVALRLVKALNREGIKNENIFLDPITQPVCTESMAALETTAATAELHRLLPDVHLLCGLRNISFHLPQRRLLDMVFLPLAMAAGVDAAILDPCDKVIMTSVMTAEVLLGQDEYCLRYIQAHRAGWLGQF